MDVMKKWQVYCFTESNVQETWRFTQPECCPNNTNHVIDHDTIKCLESKMVSNPQIQNMFISAKSWQNTNGYYMMQGYNFLITESNYSHFDLILPTKRCVYGLKMNINDSNVGDKVSIKVNPNTVCGYITSDVNIGESNIPVSSTVVQNVIPGFYVNFGTYSNVTDEAMVLNVDVENNNILLDRGITNDLTVGSLVMANVYIIKDYVIGVPGIQEVGYGTFAGKVLEQNTNIHLCYNNVTGGSKSFSYNSEYTY